MQDIEIKKKARKMWILLVSSKEVVFTFYGGTLFSLANMFLIANLLGAEGRGVIQLLLSLRMLICPLLTMGLGYGYCKSYKNNNYFPELRAVLFCIVVVATSGILCCISFFDFGIEHISKYKLQFLIYCLLSTISTFLMDVSKIEKRLVLFRQASLLPPILQLFGFVCLLIVDRLRLGVVLYVLCLSVFLQSLYLYHKFKKQYKDLTKYEKNNQNYLKYSINVALSLLLIGLANTIDKLFIAKYFSTYVLGQISVLVGCSLFITKAFEAIAMKHFANEVSGEVDGVIRAKECISVMFLCILLSPIFYLVGEFVIPFIFSSEFSNLGYYFVIVSVNAVINGLTGVVSFKLLISNEPHLISARTCFVVILFGLSLFLLQDYGVVGILLSTLISASMKLIITLFLARYIQAKKVMEL